LINHCSKIIFCLGENFVPVNFCDSETNQQYMKAYELYSKETSKTVGLFGYEAMIKKLLGMVSALNI